MCQLDSAFAAGYCDFLHAVDIPAAAAAPAAAGGSLTMTSPLGQSTGPRHAPLESERRHLPLAVRALFPFPVARDFPAVAPVYLDFYIDFPSVYRDLPTPALLLRVAFFSAQIAPTAPV